MEHTTEVKKKKSIAITRVCIIAIVTLVIMLGWILIQTIDNIQEEYVTINFEEYGKWNGHIEDEEEDIKSGLYIFPEQIKKAKDTKYFYYCANCNLSINEYLIYAEVIYTQEEYLKEKERLADIKCKVKLSQQEEIINNIVYSEDMFEYPAYISIYASNLSYEYALLDEEERKIVYIYSQLKDANNILSSDYIPIECQGKDMYANNSWDNVNIYYGRDKNDDYSYFKDN